LKYGGKLPGTLEVEIVAEHTVPERLRGAMRDADAARGDDRTAVLERDRRIDLLRQTRAPSGVEHALLLKRGRIGDGYGPFIDPGSIPGDVLPRKSRRRAAPKARIPGKKRTPAVQGQT